MFFLVFQENVLSFALNFCFDLFFQPDMIQLELDRTCPGGLGFSLVTAEKDHQTGVFVRSILPNSQADRDGRLQVMDRIVQVNISSTGNLRIPSTGKYLIYW